VNQFAGLNILEMHGLDEKNMLLVIKEKMAKSKHLRIYGCILDYNKMDLFLYCTCIECGLLFYKNNIPQWNLQQMKI